MKTTAKNLLHVTMSIIALTSSLTISMNCYGQVRQLRSFFEKKEGSYFGYELAMGYKASTLYSNVSALNSLRNGQLNTTAGVVFLNEIGKFRANIGLSYSDDRVPYTINSAEAGVMTNLYILRWMNVKSDLIEPYLVGRLGYQRAKFFGNYMSKDKVVNYSQCDMPAIGQVGWANALGGVGVDVKVAGDNMYFIHMFGEILTGANFLNHSSNADLANTRTASPLRATFGISFGLTRQP